MTQSTQTTVSQASNYFDLFAKGSGLVSRIRDVTGKRKGAKPSTYCVISVPLDSKGTENPRWTTFDVRVCGEGPQALIDSLREDVAAGRKPRIDFTLGDLYGHAWMRGMEHGRTEVRATFKARLINAALSDVDAPALSDVPLTVRGLGYANVRDNQLALSIGALHGDRNDVEYTYFDVVASETNLEVVAALKQIQRIKALNDQDKVLIGFELANPRLTGFVFGEASQSKGELGTVNCADLIAVSWLRVNGNSVELDGLVSPEPAEPSQAEDVHVGNPVSGLYNEDDDFAY